MNIPTGFIEIALTGIVGFIFKVVFGLIEKNKQQSETDDRRLESEIKALRTEMHAMDERHRQHENNLFEKSADAREAVAYMKGMKDGEKGS